MNAVFASADACRDAYPARLGDLADRLGSASAALCALHCATMPILLLALPALSGSVLGSAVVELGYAGFASLLATLSLIEGYRRHRALAALRWLVPGLGIVWAGLLLPGLHEPPLLHAAIMTLGGSLIAVAHVLNLRLRRLHYAALCCTH